MEGTATFTLIWYHWLFFNLIRKKNSRVTHFENKKDEETANTVTQNGKCTAYFLDSVFKLLRRRKKRVYLYGEKLEKYV